MWWVSNWIEAEDGFRGGRGRSEGAVLGVCQFFLEGIHELLRARSHALLSKSGDFVIEGSWFYCWQGWTRSAGHQGALQFEEVELDHINLNRVQNLLAKLCCMEENCRQEGTCITNRGSKPSTLQKFPEQILGWGRARKCGRPPVEVPADSMEGKWWMTVTLLLSSVRSHFHKLFWQVWDPLIDIWTLLSIIDFR